MDMEEINQMCQQLNLDESDGPVVRIEKSTIYAEGKEKMNLCLIGNIKGSKLANREALEIVLNLAWKFSHRIKGETLSVSNVFAFYFGYAKDKQRVLTGRPWIFEQQIIVMVKPKGWERSAT